MEAWYEPLREHTFRTELVEFSPEEARAMIAGYWHRKRADEDGDSPEPLSDEESALLSGLKQVSLGGAGNCQVGLLNCPPSNP